MNLSVSSIDDLSSRITAAGAEHEQQPFTGPATGRQPVHTVYVPADRFSRTTPADFGAEALRLFNIHTPGAGTFGAAFDLVATGRRSFRIYLAGLGFARNSDAGSGNEEVETVAA